MVCSLRHAVLVVTFFTLVACSREADAARGDDQGPPPAPERLRKLFSDAADCPNRYKCAPLDELLRMIEGPAARETVGAAFDLMAEGKVRSIDRQGEFAQKVVSEWLLQRRNEGTLDPDTAAWCMARIGSCMKTCDPSLVGGLQLTALNSKLPGAMDQAEEDIVKPGKTVTEACVAGRFLSGYLDDYSRVKRWLATAGDNGVAGAICALHHFDHDLFDVEKDELPLLRKVAARANLDPTVAFPLLGHVEIHHTDPRFRAVAGLLTRHPDENVRTLATRLAQ